MGRVRPRAGGTVRLLRASARAGADIAGALGLSKNLLPVRGTRKLSKRDMLWNDACPKITVDPETFDVFVDGTLATCEPARELPLARRYMLR